MSADVFPIVIERGASFSERYVWLDSTDEPVDLTGYTGSMVVHQVGAYGSAMLTATTANGKMVLGTEDGSVDVDFTAAETNALQAGDYYYVIELTDAGGSGLVFRIAEGVASVRER